MAAGAQATTQGWRWSYQTMGIFNAIFLLTFLFLYEETKYVPMLNGQPTPEHDVDENPARTKDVDDKLTRSETKTASTIGPSNLHHELDTSIPMNTWRKRLALITPTPEPMWAYYYRPFYVLVSFPHVAFAAWQYAASVVWLTILASVISLVFPLPPYNFNPEQIGFMSLGPFIGNLLGAFYGGLLGDRSILFFSRRNKGFYEPEMRLYILHLPVIAMAGGIIMFGLTIARVSCMCLFLPIEILISFPSRACTGFTPVSAALSSGLVWAVSAMRP